jgi:hypothetical protein
VIDKDSCDTEIEGVEPFMPNSFPYRAVKWTDVFEIECSVKYPAPPIHLWRLLEARPLLIITEDPAFPPFRPLFGRIGAVITCFCPRCQNCDVAPSLHITVTSVVGL